MKAAFSKSFGILCTVVAAGVVLIALCAIQEIIQYHFNQ